MDMFEEFSKKMTSMDETGRDRLIAEQKDRCVCSVCPTYNECMGEKHELCYCIVGCSPTCTFEKKGCICPTCPLKVTLGLSKSYYCIKGSEQEQRMQTPLKKPYEH
jgi:hypothetical protein